MVGAAVRVSWDAVDLPAVIAGLDPAIPIMWYGRAFLSEMAGSSPAMTTPRVNRTVTAREAQACSRLVVEHEDGAVPYAVSGDRLHARLALDDDS